MIYFTSERGAFRSSDGGATWRECVLPGSGAKIRAIATSLHHPDTAYLSYSDLKLDGKTWLGVAKSTNAGDDWQLDWKESSAPATNVHDDWITDRVRDHLGRESAEYDHGRPGSQPCLRDRSGPYRCALPMAARPGTECIRARSTTRLEHRRPGCDHQLTACILIHSTPNASSSLIRISERSAARMGALPGLARRWVFRTNGRTPRTGWYSIRR